MIPRHRGECPPLDASRVRRCPHRECRYHLEHERESCALDVAEGGETTAAEVAELLGIAPTLVRKIEERALAKLRRRDLTSGRAE